VLDTAAVLISCHRFFQKTNPFRCRNIFTEKVIPSLLRVSRVMEPIKIIFPYPAGSPICFLLKYLKEEKCNLSYKGQWRKIHQEKQLNKF
jgi:hypothetical protein